MNIKKIVTKIVAPLLTVIIISTVLSACGKKETDSLKRVEEAGELTVVGSGGYPPFNYIEDGQVVGFDVEVGEEIAKRLGVELNYVTSDWDGLTEGLRSKRYDAILGSMAITDDKLEVVDFTIPYYYSGAQLFVNKDSQITAANQMSEKTIAVATGTNFVRDAEELGAKVSYYQDDNATLMELVNGRVDGVITDKLVGFTAMKDIAGGENIEFVGKILRLESMGIAINKEDTELLNRINEILQDMHDDGTLTQISEKWLDGVDVSVK
jgi:polar amino acid transport system substrate-binding protein